MFVESRHLLEKNDFFFFCFGDTKWIVAILFSFISFSVWDAPLAFIVYDIGTSWSTIRAFFVWSYTNKKPLIKLIRCTSVRWLFRVIKCLTFRFDHFFSVSIRIGFFYIHLLFLSSSSSSSSFLLFIENNKRRILNEDKYLVNFSFRNRYVWFLFLFRSLFFVQLRKVSTNDRAKFNQLPDDRR